MARVVRYLTLNERGHRVGESHPRSKLTNAQVEEILILRDEGWSYGALAKRYSLPKATVQSLCSGRTRSQLVIRWKKVEVK